MSGWSPGTVTVAVSAHEWPEALEVMLRALADQDGPPFEIVVADDGSGPETAAVVDRWCDRLELQHVWQPHEGFRKARIMNVAALAATGDYLVFLDGDSLPRRGFLEAVRRAVLPGWFLSSKRVNLREPFSRRVVEGQLPVWRWSAAEWLIRAPREVRRPGFLVPARDRRRPWREDQPEFSAPGAAYCMFGVFRSDFERVNGYDARAVRWIDGEDQDLATRLRRAGLRCGWAGPASTLFHLWHPPRRERSIVETPLFRETEASDHVEAVVGLRELVAELGAAQVSAKRVGASSSSSEPVKR